MKTILFYIVLLLPITPILAQNQSGAALEKDALETYNGAYMKDDPATQAEAFEKAAGLFDAAANAYTKEGAEAEKIESMKAMAGLARQNASARKRTANYTTLSDITGTGFKFGNALINPERIRLGAGMSYVPSPGITDDFFPDAQIDDILLQVYSDPEVFEPIFYELGEFFLGDFSAPPSFSNESIGGSICWQGAMDFRLTGNLYGGVDFSKRTHTVSAEFPVTSIPISGGSPTTFPGTIQTDLGFTSAGIHLRYQLARAPLQPSFSGSIGNTWVRRSPTSVYIGNTNFHLDPKESPLAKNLRFVAAVSMVILRHQMMELEGQVRKTFFFGSEAATDGPWELGFSLNFYMF